MADRYCRNCGHELGEDDRFCPNCGRPVHEVAHVPTPEADVPVPPPPEQTGDTAPPTQQVGAPTSRRSAIAGRLFVGCIVVVFALFALFVFTSITGGGDGKAGRSGKAGGSRESGVVKEKKQPPISCEVGPPATLASPRLP